MNNNCWHWKMLTWISLQCSLYFCIYWIFSIRNRQVLRGKSNIQKLEDRALSGKDRNEKGGKAGAGWGAGGMAGNREGTHIRGGMLCLISNWWHLHPPNFTCRTFKLFSYILYFSLGLSAFSLENASGSESLQQGGWLAGRPRQRQNRAPGRGATRGAEGREAPVGRRH